MTDAIEQKHARVTQALRLERPSRMPLSDWVMVEYRPDVYHLGEGEPRPDKGEVGRTRNGRRLVTRDGGVWATDAKEKYPDYTAVLEVDLEQFEPEPVAEPMLSAMERLLAQKAAAGFPLPLHYGTAISRATIEFGWEPFLMASALAPAAFGRILDCFGRASLAVAKGWARTPGVEMIVIHDDIASTRGLMLSPQFLGERVFPWYGRIFDAIHEQGRKVLYISDGNYADALDSLLAMGTDGLYIESSSMPPEPFMRRAGRDKLFLIKTESRTVDMGTPQQIHDELAHLAKLHQEFPGMMIYRGGGEPAPGNAEAFARSYEQLLVYE